MVEYIVKFCDSYRLRYRKDAVGNLLVSKEATAGKRHLPPLVLQAHLDMVCEKNRGVEFDFENDSLQIFIDGEWLRARGTTLGADNGIGVAAMLALLASDDVVHPPLECLFTVDEECGMTGAAALERGFLTGSTLVNLDSDDLHTIYIGCAGGMNTVAQFPVEEVAAPADYFFFSVEVKGLLGGHSGDDIHRGRANAVQLLAEYIDRVRQSTDVVVHHLEGGNQRNAIAREASALLGVPFRMKEEVRILLNIYIAEVEARYAVSDPSIRFVLGSEALPTTVLSASLVETLLGALLAAPHGVIAMSGAIDGLVETSTNLASIKRLADGFEIATMQRSSDEGALSRIADDVAKVFCGVGATVIQSDRHPGWQPNLDSSILRHAVATHRSLFGVDPKVLAVHAGLECGLFRQKFPEMDMISIGPNMEAIHSPDERLHIPSVASWWEYLKLLLANM